MMYLYLAFILILSELIPSKFLLSAIGGRAYGEFIDSLSPSMYVAFDVLQQFFLPILLVCIFIKVLSRPKSLASDLPGKILIWVGASIMLIPLVVRFVLSLVPSMESGLYILLGLNIPLQLIGSFLVFLGLIKVALCYLNARQLKADQNSVDSVC